MALGWLSLGRATPAASVQAQTKQQRTETKSEQQRTGEFFGLRTAISVHGKLLCRTLAGAVRLSSLVACFGAAGAVFKNFFLVSVADDAVACFVFSRWLRGAASSMPPRARAAHTSVPRVSPEVPKKSSRRALA